VAEALNLRPVWRTCSRHLELSFAVDEAVEICVFDSSAVHDTPTILQALPFSDHLLETNEVMASVKEAG
jgi:hypothetical protein